MGNFLTKVNFLNINDSKQPNTLYYPISDVDVLGELKKMFNIQQLDFAPQNHNSLVVNQTSIESVSFDQTTFMFVIDHEKPSVSSISYIYKFNQKTWHWSPDLINFMPVSNMIVSGGLFDGKEPADINKEVIQYLHNNHVDISLIDDSVMMTNINEVMKKIIFACLFKDHQSYFMMPWDVEMTSENIFVSPRGCDDVERIIRPEVEDTEDHINIHIDGRIIKSSWKSDIESMHKYILLAHSQIPDME